MDNKRWFAVNTKPRNEERAASNISQGGFDVLAPKLLVKKYRRDKIVPVIEEMFPGYIFVRFHPIEDFHLIKYTRGVKTIVHFGNKIVPIQDEAIEFIRSNLRDGIAVMEKKPFKKGERLLIKDGPFKGFLGIFEKELEGKERVMILLDSVQFAATIEINRELVANV